MQDYSTLKFGEIEEVHNWANDLSHDVCCQILAERFDDPAAAQSTDWRDYFTTEELRGFAAEQVAHVCNVPA